MRSGVALLPAPSAAVRINLQKLGYMLLFILTKVWTVCFLSCRLTLLATFPCCKFQNATAASVSISWRNASLSQCFLIFQSTPFLLEIYGGNYKWKIFFLNKNVCLCKHSIHCITEFSWLLTVEVEKFLSVAFRSCFVPSFKAKWLRRSSSSLTCFGSQSLTENSQKSQSGEFESV